MRKISYLLLMTSYFFLNSFCGILFGYIDKETHPALTEEAVTKSGLDKFLIEYLEISEGIKQEFTNEELTQLFPGKITKSVLDWLKFGSKYEDVGDRALNHFYDPLRNTGSSEL